MGLAFLLFVIKICFVFFAEQSWQVAMLLCGYSIIDIILYLILKCRRYSIPFRALAVETVIEVFSGLLWGWHFLMSDPNNNDFVGIGFTLLVFGLWCSLKFSFLFCNAVLWIKSKRMIIRFLFGAAILVLSYTIFYILMTVLFKLL